MNISHDVVSVAYTGHNDDGKGRPRTVKDAKLTSTSLAGSPLRLFSILLNDPDAVA